MTPQRKLTCPQTLASVCEVVNETVAAEAVSTCKPPLKRQGVSVCYFAADTSQQAPQVEE